MNKWMTRGLLTGATVLLVARAYTYETGPPDASTGAPLPDGETSLTCNQPACHNDNPLNETDAGGHPTGSITLTGVPDRYVPGTTYTVSVQVAKPGQSRWGFQVTAKKADATQGGEIKIKDAVTTQFADPDLDPTCQYIEHTFDGTARGQNDVGPTWTFDWVAPEKGSGAVTFYGAGNAANNNRKPEGDFIYTTSVTSQEGAAGPPIVYGDLNGDGKVNVQDATLLLQIAVGKVRATDAQLAAGDVAPVPGVGPRAGQPFGDGKINVTDATRILRRAVGLEKDPFP